MRILVTGGAGFIGSNLISKLLKSNEVICLDNLYTGSRSNINQFFPVNNFEFLRHDVTFPIFLEVDQIFHLACPASPIHYQKFPVQTIKTSLLGSINMLGMARRLNIPILLSSTSEIYGDPQISPQDENYWGNVNPVGPRSCYDEGKRAAETLFTDYKKQYGLNTKIARIFNTYGPNMSPEDGRVVSNFIVQALKHEDLTIYGDGSQTRSFCYIDDLVNGLVKLMQSKDNSIGPINLGNPNEMPILDLAKLILELTKSKSKIKFLNLPTDDPKQRKPSIEKAKKDLGWVPSVDIKDGLLETISYFTSVLKSA